MEFFKKSHSQNNLFSFFVLFVILHLYNIINITGRVL